MKVGKIEIVVWRYGLFMCISCKMMS